MLIFEYLSKIGVGRHSLRRESLRLGLERTLLGHIVVAHRLLGRITAATVRLLRIQLGMRSHGMTTLLRVAIAHLRHARRRHSTVTTAHAVAAHRATTWRVASTRTVIRGLVHTNSATVEPIRRIALSASSPANLGLVRSRNTHSILFMAAIARCASSSLV